MITLSTVGLVCVVLAWGYQLVRLMQGSTRIQTVFVALYALGVLILVIDGFSAGFISGTVLNLASLVLALGVLVLLSRRSTTK